MKKYFDILRRCPLFMDISEHDLSALLPCLGARVEHFDRKSTIIGEGSPAKYIGVILSGSAQVVQMDYCGNRSIVSGVETADVFSESYACAGISSMPASIIANEPCEVMLIDSVRITSSCSNACGFHQKLIYNLMKELATKNIMFHQKIEVTSKRTTREKLMAYLMLQAKKKGSNSFVIPFNRQELADYLEVDRSGLSVEIGKLRSEGVLLSERNSFTLLK
ncbi:MAG: Crp/Fnr family transcriptional regulator [Oscillospiraceae bacterium]|nr:Crp/Fnr family transcriptional regulator [Oscillospiraceae bacterium]